jgi:hypothetical protein
MDFKSRFPLRARLKQCCPSDGIQPPVLSCQDFYEVSEGANHEVAGAGSAFAATLARHTAGGVQEDRACGQCRGKSLPWT